MTHHDEKRQDRESGQSLVEISLGLIVLIFIFMGIIDFGRAYFTYIALEDAAAEGAVYLSINPFCPEPTSGDCDDPNNAQYRALNSGGGNVVWDEVRYEYTVFGTAIGEPVSVEVEYDFQLITPIIPRLIGTDTIVLRSSSTQFIIAKDIVNK